MKKRKICALLTAIVMSSVVFTGCGDKQVEEPKSQTESVQTDKEEESAVKAPEKDVEMKYISKADAEKEVNNEDYLFVDLRKHADFAEGHITGAVSADVDAAVQGDFKAGYDVLENVIRDKDKDMDKKIVLICYTGHRYAQNGTNILSVMGYDMDKVFTLEGGMKAWK